jgi:tetratricopeptide (TPR) repeat protein
LSPRPARIHHCTSEPYRFFGRSAELGLLDRALAGGEASVVALVGPGGQGKTAIMQHWLERVRDSMSHVDGLFLWSFYRGKDADLCLRELYAYAAGLVQPPDTSASYCVDRLLPILRRERWALVFDGMEVAQYDSGSWFGRFVHPELGRLIEELATEPLPGVVVLTTRFPLPTLAARRHAQLISLGSLDPDSACGLLESLGVRGERAALAGVAAAGGFHAKAVELLGTYLTHYQGGDVRRLAELPQVPRADDASDEEHRVSCVLSAYQDTLPVEAKDILALATAFRDPPTEPRLREYLVSTPVRALLHQTWGRTYTPFAERAAEWVASQIQELIDLRLLERVGRGTADHAAVIDAHPLVRRAFEHVLGSGGRRERAQARAGFLRGRPDRQKPQTLEQAREEVEMFHAYCDAGLWNEADSTFVALDNPKHRFLAPAFERDLLLQFFPHGNWHEQPLWPGFGRYRSLAICFEQLGQFEEALTAYPAVDAPLRGDALLALGRLAPLLDLPQAPAPWQTLWQAYRAHTLALAGQTEQALALAHTLVPVDVYEWLHVFECLLRTEQLGALDLRSVLFRPPQAAEHRWAELARQRMRADYRRLREAPGAELGHEYRELEEAYDCGGLPFERALTRLSHVRWLIARQAFEEATHVNRVTLALAQQHSMRIIEADAWHLTAEIARHQDKGATARAVAAEEEIRRNTGYAGTTRP